MEGERKADTDIDRQVGQTDKLGDKRTHSQENMGEEEEGKFIESRHSAERSWGRGPLHKQT